MKTKSDMPCGYSGHQAWSSRKSGRVVYNRLAAGFPEPLRDHCLRRLVELTRDTREAPVQ